MKKNKAFFVTGTGTGIGKTYVSRLLADTIGERSGVSYMKPVQTGCSLDPRGELRAPDFDFVNKGRAVMKGSYEQHVPYRFLPACSPHLAAGLDGTTISFEHIQECFSAIADGDSVVLIEGAGGVLTPLSGSTSMSDLILSLDVPVILVTSPELGTLNQTFLTLSWLAAKQIEIAGIIINSTRDQPHDFIHRDNDLMIRSRCSPRPVLEVHYGDECNDSVRKFCAAIGCI